MSANTLTEDLPDLIGDVVAVIAAAQKRETVSTPARPDVDASSLRAVMRSSRARAWIPSHLIESLITR